MAKFDKVIPPGQEGKVKLVIEGSKVHGSFSKSATVHTNDPDNPTMTLTVAGNEVPFVEVSPSEKVYLQGFYGESIEKTVVISSNEQKAGFEVVRVESNIDDKITYKLEAGPEEGQYSIRIFKNPKLPNMNTYGTLTVYTNSENAPEKVVQVQVVTKGSITVQPSTLNYGAVKFGMDGEDAPTVMRSVTVIRSEGVFDIRDIEFSSELYEAKVEELAPGKRFKVDVTFRPPVKRDPRQREVGEMIIHTSDPREPTLTVKLVARAM